MNESDKNQALLKRTIRFSRSIVHLCRTLKDDEIARWLTQQLFRSATSVGANLHEAQGAQSRKDFISKISISQKESIETTYWLQLICEEKLGAIDDARRLYDEASELAKIFSSILISCKKRM